MHARTQLAGVAAAAILAGAVTASATDMKNSPATAANPLLAPWSGPYSGVPPFDKTRPEHLAPALEAAMAENLAEVDRIANDPAAPTFENTIAAMERTGRTLDRVSTVYGIFVSNLNDDAVTGGRARDGAETRGIQRQDHSEREALPRIAAVYDSRETPELTPEQQRLAWLYYTNFVRAGAKLDPAAKERCRASTSGSPRSTQISARTSSPTRSDHVLRARERGRARRPAGVSACRGRRPPRSPAARRASGWSQYALEHRAVPHLLGPPRSAREGVAHVRQSRRQRRRDTTTTPSSPRSSQLRAERAKLLGYRDARALAAREHHGQDARARDGADGGGVDAGGRAGPRGSRRHAGGRRPGRREASRIEPWDYRYYAEKVRKAKYDLDENEIKPYLQLEKLREGMFWVAGELFGFRFTPVDRTSRSITPTCASGR